MADQKYGLGDVNDLNKSTTGDKPKPDGELADKALLDWLRIKFGEGLVVLKKERAWEQINDAIKYVDGKQHQLKSKTISRIIDNRLRKTALETVATMTDVRPIWNFETYVPEYQRQAEILNKLSKAWWTNTFADRKLASILLYACVGGSGYGLLTFNSKEGDLGDLELVPFDPRDVVPIDPTYTDDINDWRGIILRQRLPLETVRKMFPSKAHKLFGKETAWSPSPTAERKSYDQIITPVWDALEGRKSTQGDSPGIDLMRAYVRDDSLNLTDNPIVMGTGDFAYTVYPMGSIDPYSGETVTKKEAKLYPRGRLIIFTPETILRDIPNPHWHGKFPVIRFTLDRLPWSLLGSSMIGDLIPLQDALNEALRGAEDGLNQWVRRSVAADKRSMPKAALDALDTRQAGIKVHYNPAVGEPFKIIDGPDPEVFGIYKELIDDLKTEIEDISGMRGVTELSQLGQMPASDTLEKYMEALSPTLRLRSRSLEYSLGQLAQLLKVSFFQWYTAPRRIQLLGKDGISKQDFDMDAGTLVPKGPEPRRERAIKHQSLFSFQVAPNSWLNVSHAQQKMFYLQLFREQVMDPWSVWNQFDITDTGPEPADTIPARIVKARETGLMQGPTPELVMAQLQQQLLQIQQQIQQLQMPPGAAPPGGGPPSPNAGAGPTTDGRPPTGAVPPHQETRDGGMRPVVSESR
jgi:hypothetical protein